MKKKIGNKTTFQLTENEKKFLENTATKMEISMAALVRGIIRFNKEKMS